MALAARVEQLGEIDATAELARLVRRLIAASEADPLNMPLARELRVTLLALPGLAEDDPVARRQATVEARQAARRAGLAVVGGGREQAEAEQQRQPRKAGTGGRSGS